ncbi:Flavin monooxygenase-like domain containing protein [Dorcoceras hygrometricum]|uniref:Flavin monooxygenase-like domain containing protein n=1 Tax=Dorcoceras hygrometricum TaxID=472368 RepID=A0A2Z7C1H8_9LAMI|nr:Flavin monooxygenase-like domain containing protein [Dorcoceras hygrometricum]
MMNSRRICPADGSQYKDSAVGLVFMESAAGLAMETSKAESAVRNQAEAKLKQLEHTVMTSAVMSSQSAVGNQQMKKAAGALSVDDISSDVIIQQEATVISRKLSADEKRSERDEATSWFESRIRKRNQQVACTTRRKQQQHPVVSYNESAVAIYPVDMESQTQEKKKQAMYRDSTSRELQYPVAGNPGARYPVVVMNQQRSS